MLTFSRVQRATLLSIAWAAYLGWPAPVAAADITDVADAADTIILGKTEREDLFDLYAGAQFRMILSNGKITREPINRPLVTNKDCVDLANSRDCLPVDELRWKRNVNILDFGGQIGLFHDIALTWGLHYILADVQKFRYARGVTPQSSSVTSMQPATNEKLFEVPFESQHQGWGNIGPAGEKLPPLDVGLRFGPLNDERDDSKPAWVISFTWGIPWLADAYDPSVRATESTPGSEGDGVHRLTFGTAFSKRVGSFGLIGIDPEIYRRGYLDPYFELTYSLPVPQKGRARKPLVESKTNPFGTKPSHIARFNAGVEIVALEDLKTGRRVAIDLGLRSTFLSEGRNYSVLTDPLGELTFTEQILHIGGVIGIYIQAAEFIRFKAGVKLGYNTEHFVTFEEVGDDKNGDGQVLPPAQDPSSVKDVTNPYFCGNAEAPNTDRCVEKGQPSYDQIGFRFKDEEHTIFSWFASLIFTF